jgi:phage terminase large subunit-like protein
MPSDITVDQVFRENLALPEAERTLPWEESRDGVTVVVEPKPHYAEDMTAWHLSRHAFCHYRDWKADGAKARFFDQAHKTGDEVMMTARVMVIREIEAGEWS